MPAHSELVVTLVAAFVAAFAGGMLAARLGLPSIVGYLMAGIVIGPNTPFGSADTALAAQLAEVGVVLLMFGVGLNFSLQDLAAVGPIAIPGALVHSTAATFLGLGLSQVWGWSLSEGLVFGVALSIASTVVLLRTLEDLNLLDTTAGRVAVGWLVVEDILTVAVLVLLPALSGSGEHSNGLAASFAEGDVALGLVLSLLQTSLFVLIVLVAGRQIIPRLLREVVRSGSRELFTLCILALALGVAYGSAELFGSSLALGAFLAGVVLNESELSHRAGLEALPMRDAFAVLFFVSVGMLFEPAVLRDNPLHVLLVVAAIIVGKSAAAFPIVVGLGYGLRTGLVVSAALAQVGEFSFILASLGTALDLLTPEANSLILAGSLISITVNPFLFRSTDAAEELVGRWDWLRVFGGRRVSAANEELSLRRHVIICGFGRAGSSLARSLRGRDLPFVVIENERFVYERARAAGYACVLGDAAVAAVLEQARIKEARCLAVTFGDEPAAPLTAQHAKQLNPDIDIIAKGYGPDAHALMRQAGANEVVDQYFESSLEFVRHVLHRYGIDGRQIAALQARWRAEYYRNTE